MRVGLHKSCVLFSIKVPIRRGWTAGWFCWKYKVSFVKCLELAWSEPSTHPIGHPGKTVHVAQCRLKKFTYFRSLEMIQINVKIYEGWLFQIPICPIKINVEYEIRHILVNLTSHLPAPSGHRYNRISSYQTLNSEHS